MPGAYQRCPRVTVVTELCTDFHHAQGSADETHVIQKRDSNTNDNRSTEQYTQLLGEQPPEIVAFKAPLCRSKGSEICSSWE